MLAAKQLRFDQAVHGYRDGHGQIVGSVILDYASADLMAVLSDQLTSSPLLSTETYITGYPLKAAHKYVLAQTWAAPEMPRPGCVWTHSLIVDYQSVASLADARRLARLFKRPSLNSLHEFSMPIDFQADGEVERGEIPINWSRSIVEQFYCSEELEKFVTLRSISPATDEALMLSLWSQLPPRLRRTIFFCTRDVQNVSGIDASLNVRFSDEVLRSGRASISDTTSFTIQEEGACQLLAADLTRQRVTPLRRFLRRYSVDAKSSRKAILALSKVFFMLTKAKDKSAFRELAHEIGTLFPSPTEAVLLKIDVLFGRPFKEDVNHERQEYATLGALDAADSNAFPIAVPSVADVAEAFLPDHSKEYLSAIFKGSYTAPEGALRERFFSSLCELTDAKVLASLRFEANQRIVLAKRRPDVVRECEFWSRDVAERLDVLRQISLEPGDIEPYLFCCKSALTAMEIGLLVDYQPIELAKHVSALWDQGWLDGNASHLIVRRLAEFADCLPNLVKTSESIPVDVLGLIGISLAATKQVRSVDAETWARVITRSGLKLSADESTLAVLLFISVSGADIATRNMLVDASLDPLYTLAWNGRVSKLEEDLLDAHLPNVGRERNWDFCFRLIKALVDPLIEINEIETAVGWKISPPATAGVINYIRHLQRGTDLLKKMESRLPLLPGAEERWGDSIREALRPKNLWESLFGY